jgi:hypothetical protein
LGQVAATGAASTRPPSGENLHGLCSTTDVQSAFPLAKLRCGRRSTGAWHSEQVIVGTMPGTNTGDAQLEHWQRASMATVII